MHDHHAPRQKHVGWILRLCLAGCLAVLVGLSAAGVEIDGVKVTLHSRKYYAKWDMTRFVYRVKSADLAWGDAWILSVDSCVLDAVDVWSSSYYEWVETPMDGLRFERYTMNQKFYLWLYGNWDVGAVPVGVVRPGASRDNEQVTIGSIDGPACISEGLSLEVIQGGAIAFPDLQGIGREAATEGTRLRIVTSATGWMLSYALSFDIPNDASEEMVRRIFDVQILPYAPGDHTTEVDVAYAVDIGEDDLIGLPEGEYAITIRFTVTTD